MNECSANIRNDYVTLESKGCNVYTEKKSVFHSIAAPISNGSEALHYIESARSEYPDAVHHVYAWIAGDIDQRNKYSDDGEPSGTAGLPVLDILRKRGIEDAVIVVSRYFGGTLLGTGGLVKAYSTAASNAIENAVPVRMVRCLEYMCVSNYQDHERIRQRLKDSSAMLTDIIYGENVSFKLSIPYDIDVMTLKAINEVTSGRIKTQYAGYGYIKASGFIL